MSLVLGMVVSVGVGKTQQNKLAKSHSMPECDEF